MLIRVERIEALVLQHVGAQLVRQADPTAFLVEIQQHAAAERAYSRDRRAQLLAAVAAQTAEQSPVRHAECKRTGTRCSDRTCR